MTYEEMQERIRHWIQKKNWARLDDLVRHARWRWQREPRGLTLRAYLEALGIDVAAYEARNHAPCHVDMDGPAPFLDPDERLRPPDAEAVASGKVAPDEHRRVHRALTRIGLPRMTMKRLAAWVAHARRIEEHYIMGYATLRAYLRDHDVDVDAFVAYTGALIDEPGPDLGAGPLPPPPRPPRRARTAVN